MVPIDYSKVLALLGRVKREAGVNPARSRHCEQRAGRQVVATVSSEMGRPPVCDDLSVRRPALVKEARYLVL